MIDFIFCSTEDAIRVARHSLNYQELLKVDNC